MYKINKSKQKQMIEKINLNLDDELLKIARTDLSKFNDFKTTLNEPSGRFFYDEWQCKQEYKNTVWKTILDLLPYEKGEARIIKLDIKSCYTRHADIDDRWHLNLGYDPSFLIDLDNNNLYTVDPGIWYTMDAGKLHSAANFGDTPRYHLVVRKLLHDIVLHEPVQVSIKVIDTSSHYRYHIDNKLSPFMNKKVKQKLLTNFHIETDKNIYFKLEKSEVDSLKNILSSIELELETNFKYCSI